MKLGLFLAFLVLVASTNVQGQRGEKTRERKDRTRTDGIESDQSVTPTDRLRETNKPIAVIREETKPITILHDADKPVTIVDDGSKPITVIHDADKPITILDVDSKPIKVVENDVQPHTGDLQPTSVDDGRVKKRPIKGQFTSTQRNPIDEDQENGRSDAKEHDHSSEDHDKIHENKESDRRPEDHDEERFDKKPHKTSEGSSVNEDYPDSETVPVDEGKGRKPMVEAGRASEKRVHVSGNIVLVKYRSSVVDSVQYDLDGTRPVNGNHQLVSVRLPYAQDFISRQSRVTLYVSTSKTTDRKLAFAQFPY